MMRMIATVFGLGHLRPAPGTWASLAALPIAWAVDTLLGPWGFLAALVAVAAIGTWATAAELPLMSDPDPSEIVIDEIAGQWTALLPVAFGAWMVERDVLDLWPGWIAAFLLFRLFDIWKPGPVGWADRRGGATGVMLDDLIAGVFAALGVVALAAVSHLWLMR